MRSVEDKEMSSSTTNSNFEFHKGNVAAASRGASHHRTGLGKPAPSKWDDAQKWIANLSRGGGVGLGVDKNLSKTKPRNSNADDTRLIAPVLQQENDYLEAEVEVDKEANMPGNIGFEVETKNVDSEEAYWRINKPMDNSGVRSVCVRDMGTDMTPIASQEPSRTATPIRATTPVRRSPIASGTSTPIRCQHGVVSTEKYQTEPPTPADNRNQAFPLGSRENGVTGMPNGGDGDVEGGNGGTGRTGDAKNIPAQANKLNPLESRAMAWDEAERAKYTARYKREEVKIQAWENHQKRKAEMEMKKKEVKAERLKARAQEKYTNKLASTRRIAEEKRANAEAKLNEKAVKTSEKADYIRRTGHLPSTFCFSFKLPSCCW